MNRTVSRIMAKSFRLTAGQLHGLAELANGPLDDAGAMIRIGRSWRATLFALNERGLIDWRPYGNHGKGWYKLTNRRPGRRRSVGARRRAHPRERRAVVKAAGIAERERLGSIAAVEDMAATAAACYRSALAFDGMPADTAFAVFSPGNPFVVFLDRALAQFQEMAAGCAAHGYVGLSMRTRDVYKRKRGRRAV